MKKSVLVATFVLALALASPGIAASKVPLTFNDYHGYTGTVAYLKQVAAAYPNLSELLEIGRTGLGRPIYVLVLSNMATGTTIDRHVELRRPRNLEVKTPPRPSPTWGSPGSGSTAAPMGMNTPGPRSASTSSTSSSAATAPTPRSPASWTPRRSMSAPSSTPTASSTASSARSRSAATATRAAVPTRRATWTATATSPSFGSRTPRACSCPTARIRA